MSDPRDPITPIHPQMPHSSSGGVIKKAVLVIAGLLLVVVITVVAVTQLRGSHTTHHTATTAASSPSAAAFAQGGDVADRPNGCAGGTDAPNAISAAFSEPITTKGAVEFTATMLRWLWSSDVDSTQMTSVGSRVASPTIITKVSQAKAKLASGSSLSLSTKDSAAWVKDFDSSHATATVYFSAIATETDSGSPQTVQTTGVYSLTQKDGHWFMATSGDGGQGFTSQGAEKLDGLISAHGQPVIGGC